ncbi:MAG TPA: ankyrin repeat domain-containing protein [Gemmataceae bacterium]|jgi:ankyrin repeat protein|nr:ankyrin repeat domain-containing protein [Gemmataceae bacterium]
MHDIDPILTAMSDAHRRGDVEAVRELLRTHPELEKTGPARNSTWLHIAAEMGHAKLVEFWLDRGWDVDLDSPGGPKADGVYTPLHSAKDAATTRLLLARERRPTLAIG